MHVLRDSGRGVQRDRGPDRVDIRLRDMMSRRKSRAALAPSTSNRSSALLC
jgi:hypothetical protein